MLSSEIAQQRCQSGGTRGYPCVVKIKAPWRKADPSDRELAIPGDASKQLDLVKPELLLAFSVNESSLVFCSSQFGPLQRASSALTNMKVTLSFHECEI